MRVLFVSVFSIVIAFSQVSLNETQDHKPEIFIVGTIHSEHFNPENHYSIIDLQMQISALKPDLVCGEITPEAYDKEMEGYFPPEAAFLAQMASELNYSFIPVDWRMDYAIQAKADKEYPESVKEQVLLLGSTYSANRKECDCPSVYDFIHSEPNIKLIDSIFERIIGVHSTAETAHGNWHERNHRIVVNGLASANKARRIVFVFGSDHIPQIRRQLRSLGYESQIPVRLFIPTNDSKVPDKVLSRWKRNLENLRLIRDRKILVTEDNYNKVINSSRIQDIELAIRNSSSRLEK